MRVAFISLGCAKALVDTEIMMGILKENGHSITPEIESADVVVVNTCSFIEDARKETEETIEEVLSLGKRIVIAGCYVNRYRKALNKRFPGIYSTVSTEEISKIEDAIHGMKPHYDGFYLQSHTTPRLISTPPSWAYLKISEGCSRGCAFCAIPKIRGFYRSRSIEDISIEAKRLEEGGRLEMDIISQDTTYFGNDRGKSEIIPLLEKILSNTKKSWIRLLYLYPSEEILKILPLFSEKRLLPYFDIPFQHANRDVLKSMGRPWDGRKYLELIEKIRDSVEDATIRTSLIVGFPTEGPAEFDELLNWVYKARIDRLGIFTYSREKGTKAYALGDPVGAEEKSRRAELIAQAQIEISKEKNRRMVGRELEVVVEGKLGGDISFARSSHFAPEVDGGIYIRGKTSLGEFAKIKINSSSIYDLEGEVL